MGHDPAANGATTDALPARGGRQLPVRGISVVGLGKLGAPIAGCWAAAGYRVIGVDVDPHTVDRINRAEPPVHEPHLGELLARAGTRLAATDSYEEAVSESDITFVVLPTPSDPSTGAFSAARVLDAVERIGRVLPDRAPHTLVLTSTVMPGTIDGQVRPTLERAAGRRVGEALELLYSPEFVALGSVIRDFTHPPFLLLGEVNPGGGELLASLYGSVVRNNAAVARMSALNAELTKLFFNTYFTSKVSFANTVARVCEALPGSDAHDVTHALGLDERIHPSYLTGGAPYGGPCWPRDNVALNRLIDQLGVHAPLPAAVDSFNRSQVAQLGARIVEEVPPASTVAVLGLAYKPDTDVVEESPGVALCHYLVGAEYQVRAYDPLAIPAARRELDDSVRFAPDAAMALRGSDAAVITTPWPEFARPPVDVLPDHRRAAFALFDWWRIVEDDVRAAVRYVPLGRHAAGTEAGPRVVAVIEDAAVASGRSV